MSGGGKDGGSTTAPPPVDTSGTDDSMQMMQMMLAMMESMAASAGAAPAMPVMPDAPAVDTTPSIDWGEKMDSLRAKTTAEYSISQDKRKGRTDTIHTSPLLDTEEDEAAPTLIGSTKQPKKVTT